MPIVVGDVLAPGVDRDEDPLSAGMVAKLHLIWLSAAPTAQKSKTRARIAPTSNETLGIYFCSRTVELRRTSHG